MTNQENALSNPRSTLVELLSGACLELFSSYEAYLMDHTESVELDENSVNFIALIGVSDSAFRATLTMCVTPALLKASFPASEEEISDSDLKDWLGELANQLAGRFKNKVVPYGRKLELGVPTVIQGVGLKVDLPKSSEITEHQFISEQGDIVELRLSTLIDEQFILNTPEETEEAEVLAEGEMLFF
jgi:CheY-specific phosphatase CheX